jgi:3-hydroxypropanoate dehydrogenase
MTTEQTNPNFLQSIDEGARRILFTEARTANAFTDEPIGEEKLRSIYDLAKFGPTSANTNPLRILFLPPGEGRERLIPHMKEGNRAKTAAAPMVAVMAFDGEFHERIPELLPFRPEMRDFFAADPAMREATARYNAALQTAYFIFAIRAEGLAAGPMVGFDPAGVDAEFFADTTWRSHLVINIGRPGPDAWMQRLPRLGFDEVARIG